eukprot:TRINITY_DN897_c0_g2_i14.p1 TRINITY_DN897_c0_g2~~TRINITY_DN897_c0_g2_i14.p1  ORF type:complete len:305 (-),score=46.03 TRINITY_DN897_c0_g2_i14:89-1003(-)
MLLLLYYVLAVVCFFQLSLSGTDHWALSLLAAIVLVPLMCGVVGYGWFRLDNRAEFYDTFKNIRKRLMLGCMYEAFNKTRRWFFLARAVYLLSHAALIACVPDSIVILQVVGLLFVQFVYTALLLWKRPYADLLIMRLQIIMHIVRFLMLAVTCTFLFPSLVSSVKSVVGLMFISAHLLVLICFFVARIIAGSRNFFLYLCPVSCRCCRSRTWDSLLLDDEQSQRMHLVEIPRSMRADSQRYPQVEMAVTVTYARTVQELKHTQQRRKSKKEKVTFTNGRVEVESDSDDEVDEQGGSRRVSQPQ